MALPTLLLAALMRAICASKRVETANPAASSSGETIFDPEDKRASDMDSMADEFESMRALVSAAMFVLITIRLLPLSHPFQGFCVSAASLPRGGFSTRGSRPFPCWPLMAANRHVLRHRLRQ